jgi:tetratricopeptide (TPR) repeat protein
MVRDAAVGALANEPPQERLRWLLRMAADPTRLVRVDVAQALNGVPLEGSSAEERDALSRAASEYIAAQQFNADRPEAHANLGAYYATAGQRDKGETELKKALAIDPDFIPAAVNLADLYRASGDESKVESTLRAALQRNPRDASMHYALGLALARQQRLPEAVAQLQQATRLAPGERHYAYVYGVALHSTGKVEQGISELAESHRKFPGDIEILQALATMERDRGNLAAGRTYAQQLVVIVPDDPQAQALLRIFGP